MKYLKKFESFKINEGMAEDLVEALYKELTELKIEKGHFSEADYNDLMSKRGLEKGMQVEIFNKLKDKGFVFEEDLVALFNELNKLKNEKGYFSVDDYYNLMDDKNLSRVAEDTFHKLVGMGFGFEDEPEEDDDDDIILPYYNLN